MLSLSLDIFADGNKSFFSLKTSYSKPVGEYAATNLEYGSYTSHGISLGAEGTWFFYKNLGLGIDINYSQHSIDVSDLGHDKVEADPVMDDVITRSEPFTAITAMAGLYYAYNVSEKFSIQPKFLIGKLYGKTPHQLFKPTYSLWGPQYFVITSSKDNGFAIKPGFSLIYNFNEYVATGLNLEYTYSQLSFGFYKGGKLEYRDRKISYIDLGLNLIIRI